MSPRGGGGAKSKGESMKKTTRIICDHTHTAWLPFLCAKYMKWLLLMEIYKGEVVKLDRGRGSKS